MSIYEDALSEIQLVQDTFPFLGELVAQIACDTANASLGALSSELLCFAAETKHLQKRDIEALKSSGRVRRALLELEKTLTVR